MTDARPPLPFRLLVIGDRRQATARRVVDAAAEGRAAVAFLLREPSLPPGELLGWALEILPLCRSHGSLLLVHGSPEVARAAGADGVHLPERGASPAEARGCLGRAALIGASRHDLAGLRAALKAGADYATLSPIWETPGKAGRLGLERLAEACAAAPGRVVPLGGVTPERASACFAVGAAAIAAVRGVWEGETAVNVRRILA